MPVNDSFCLHYTCHNKASVEPVSRIEWGGVHKSPIPQSSITKFGHSGEYHVNGTRFYDGQSGDGYGRNAND